MLYSASVLYFWRDVHQFYFLFQEISAEKKDLPYCTVMSWLRCRVSFSLSCSAIDCLRGARSSSDCPAN